MPSRPYYLHRNQFTPSRSLSPQCSWNKRFMSKSCLVLSGHARLIEQKRCSRAVEAYIGGQMNTHSYLSILITLISVDIFLLLLWIPCAFCCGQSTITFFPICIINKSRSRVWIHRRGCLISRRLACWWLPADGWLLVTCWCLHAVDCIWLSFMDRRFDLDLIFQPSQHATRSGNKVWYG